MIEHEYLVIAVHGEGDRACVNALQAHRNSVEAHRHQQYGMDIPDSLTVEPNEPPDVIIILRDAVHEMRIEHPVKTWQEVEQWKALIGFDDQKRHWKTGVKVKVTFAI